MIDPHENSNRMAKLISDRAAVNVDGSSKLGLDRGVIGDFFALDRRNRRRLQKKAFIAKAVRDTA